MALEGITGTVYGNVYSPAITRKETGNQNVIYVRIDGKYYALTLEQFRKYIEAMRNKQNKQDMKNNPYELNRENNGVRIIDEKNVSDPIHPGTSAPKNTDRVSPDKIDEYNQNIDAPNGKIDDFRQGKRGDCYLLAALQSLKNTKDGQEILAQNIKQNDDGTITVTLPGAVAVKNKYKEMGYEDKCSITGKYTITKAAIEKAKEMSGKSYAYGDIEVIAFELAIEALRAEILQTNNEIGIKSERFIAGQIGPISDSDTLSSGFTYDAVFLLTGQKSDLYEATKEKRKNAKLYIPGEFGYVGENDKKVKGLCGSRKGGIVEIEHYYNKESDLQKMLDKYKGKEDKYSITVGVIVGQSGPDGSTKAGGGHALTVTKITEDYVEVTNPWDTTKLERIPRGEFEKMAVRLNVAPVSQEHYEDFCEDNNVFKKCSWFQNILNCLF